MTTNQPDNPAPAAMEIEELERKEDAGTIEPGEQARLDIHRIVLKHGPLVREALRAVAATPASHSDLEARELLRQAMNILGTCQNNDPMEPIADNGMTVWDGMKSESDRLWKQYAALSQKPAPAVAEALFEAIQHGDDDHRAWLKEAIAAFFAGEPVPPARGGGRKDARIAELEAALVTPTPPPEVEDMVGRLREALDRITIYQIEDDGAIWLNINGLRARFDQDDEMQPLIEFDAIQRAALASDGGGR